jgi:hypothetical protein
MDQRMGEGHAGLEMGLCTGCNGYFGVEMGHMVDHGKGNDLVHYFLVLLAMKVPAFQIQINLQGTLS